MREIKFRAWNEADNKIMTMDEFKLYRDDSTKNERIAQFLNWYCDCEIMQYTGRKDKNGVEIYEGDILIHIDYDFAYIGVISFQDGAFIVTWENECCNVCWTTEEPVIGNIFENHDLLEVKEDEKEI